MMGWYGGGMGVGAWIMMGLFWVLLIGAIVWLVAQLTTSGRGAGRTPGGYGPWDDGVGRAAAAPRTPSALELLDHRLAAGEIDVATYQQTRAALLDTRGGLP
ncbi:MAG: hypothetical protein BGO38_09755 [Cellulomonas sp. 73-145]|uniref:SHOCT domain-containing protein n=1 Tax=Cellulomonas sp. 73-145 TaxID=1895739 RepID=UPI0009288919|nr:SHOCT domain-containing protein [Cellulomonas sp. 73-145]MBN9328212.1 SHOCT domain-containing protein [Cellulomonas sp.]OJV60985.1 MAG: hypothetical protein BGO38_09755 [Cellulomonas sp. 73-145]